MKDVQTRKVIIIIIIIILSYSFKYTSTFVKVTRYFSEVGETYELFLFFTICNQCSTTPKIIKHYHWLPS